MRIRVIVVAMVACLACSRETPEPNTYVPLPSIALPSPLDRVLRDYETAWRVGDSTALAALFTRDGFVPTRFGWVRGTAAIESTYANAGGDLRLRALAWATADSVGYIVGAYGWADDTTGADGGKFVLALRRGADGRWLIAADLDKGDDP
jgi:ketosteroid isomerase-like protein